MYFTFLVLVSKSKVLQSIVLAVVCALMHMTNLCAVPQLRLNVIRYAMLDMLTSPPPGFEDVINNHFRIMRHRRVSTVCCQECTTGRYAHGSGASVNDHTATNTMCYAACEHTVLQLAQTVCIR